MDTMLPTATYRLQFSPDFTFSQAQNLLPYLKQLGISHIYASPVWQATPGSTHGYDVCNPTTVNPELGTTDAFINLLQTAKEHNLGWVQDIVPNHMAFDYRNPFIFDVLFKGKASEFAKVFDIDWQHPDFGPRLMVPFLGAPLDAIIQNGELKLSVYNGHLCVDYHGACYPLRANTYPEVIGQPYTPGWHHAFATDQLQTQLKKYQSGLPENNQRLAQLLSKQHFVLTHWKEDAKSLNFRRFFTISGLICVAVEHPAAFELVHNFVLQLVHDNLIDGLRIDHIDGLRNPEGYLKTLRQHAPDTYIVAEKILEGEEKLPATWPTEGTTGYDVLTALNTHLCNPNAQGAFSELYARYRTDTTPLTQQKLNCKNQIANTQMQGDLNNLCRAITQGIPEDQTPPEGLRQALQFYLVGFPVYRSYIDAEQYTPEDATGIQTALQTANALANNPDTKNALIWLGEFLSPHSYRQNVANPAYVAAIERIQQFSGPLMAKGLEDTLFYTYNRHTALNEVGGWPGHFGSEINDMHYAMQLRSANAPHAMSATATHDTKRGEDTRARLQVLTEIPEQYATLIDLLAQHCQQCLTQTDSPTQPTPNDVLLYFQTLAGTYPANTTPNNNYTQRLTDYMIKAIREGKQTSSWKNPNAPYEAAITNFIANTLHPDKSPQFVSTLNKLVTLIHWAGYLNTLVQTTLKCTLPGIPDVYRGTESFDFSLVDPDNRRPVDFGTLKQQLHGFIEPEFEFENLLQQQPNPALKHYILHRCLQARQQYPNLFTYGTYTPLKTTNPQLHETLLAFERNHATQMALVVTRRFMQATHPNGCYTPAQPTNSNLKLNNAHRWQGKEATELISGIKITLQAQMPIDQLLPKLPVAVWVVA